MSQDDAFLQTLASCTDACADLDLSDDGWMPPVGEYTVELHDVQTGEGKKKLGVWIKPIFKIYDEVNEEFNDKNFSDFYFISPNPDVNKFVEMAPLKSLAQLATCLAGREEKDPVQCMGIINAAKGQEFLSVEIYETTSKKTGKTYKNIRFLTRLESTEEVEETEIIEGAKDVNAEVAA